MNAKELRSIASSVAVATNLKRKEADALTQVLSPEEKPLLMFGGFDKRDKARKKIILTDKSLYFVRSKIFRAAKIEAVSLSEVIDIQEKRGIFLAKATVVTGSSAINIDNVNKKASAKLVSVWREIKGKDSASDGEYSEAKKNIPAPESKKSGLFEKIYKLAVLVIAIIFIKNMIEYKPEEKKEETPSPVTATVNSNKTAIDLNTGEIVSQGEVRTEAELYEEGTLHNATIREWRKASKANKVATCADFIMALYMADKITLPASGKAFSDGYAQTLASFIDKEIKNGRASDKLEVKVVALAGIMKLGWVKK